MVFNCRVDQQYRTAWRINGSGITTESLEYRADLEARGIRTVLSTAENRQPQLIVNRTADNAMTIQCIAIQLEDPGITCDGRLAQVAFYGKVITSYLLGVL